MSTSNTQFAHLSKVKDTNYGLLYRNPNILSNQAYYEWEAAYFAMCLLVPEKPFLEISKFLGSLEDIYNNPHNIWILSNLFEVEEELIEARIYDLLSKNVSNGYIQKKVLEKTN